MLIPVAEVLRNTWRWLSDPKAFHDSHPRSHAVPQIQQKARGPGPVEFDELQLIGLSDRFGEDARNQIGARPQATTHSAASKLLPPMRCRPPRPPAAAATRRAPPAGTFQDYSFADIELNELSRLYEKR